MLREHRSGWAYRANVAARALAGTLGAYGIASLFAFMLARLWPADRIEAIIPATLLAFLVMPAVTLWAFLARGPVRVWIALIALAMLFAAIGWWAGPVPA